MAAPTRTGKILRSARERRGVSLEQAASEAGIPLRYVQLLEGERVKVGVADELYLVPFLRRYASALGLDPAELLPDFLGQVQQVPAEPLPPPRLLYRSRLAGWWKPAAVVLAIAAAAGVMIRRAPEHATFDDWPAPQGSDEANGAAAVSAAAAPEASPQAAQASTPLQTGAPVDEGTAGSPAEVASTLDAATGVAAPALDAGEGLTRAAADAALPTATPTGPIAAATASLRELRIVASEDTWLSIGIDDQPLHEVLLHPGESRSWSAREGFTLTLGNAGGVALSLDGRDIPPLGRSGQVVRNIRLPEAVPPPRGG